MASALQRASLRGEFEESAANAERPAVAPNAAGSAQRAPAETEILALVRRTRELMAAGFRRAQEVEAQSTELINRANLELTNCLERLEEMEERATRAEARCEDLEQQLQRVHDALTEEIRQADKLAGDS